MADQLTPTLTESQLTENISALQKQGIGNDKVQQYVNNYSKAPAGGYVLKTGPPPTPQPSGWQKLGNTAKEVGNAVTSSEQTLGKGLSTVTSNIPKQQADQAAQNAANVAKLLPIYHATTDPFQKAHLAATLKAMGTDVTAGDINPGFDLSNKQVLGAAAGTALDVASAGSFGPEAKEAETGKLLTKSPTIAGIAEKAGLETTLKPAETVEQIAAKKAAADALPASQKIANAAKTVVKGAAQGYGYDVAGNMQANKSNPLTPGFGTVVGGGLPLLSEAAKGAGYVAKEVAKHTASALSGVAPAAIEEAFKNPAAVQTAMRTAAQDGEGATQKVYQNAVDALKNLKTARSSAYEDNLAKLEKEATYTKGGQLYVKRELTGAEAASTRGYVPGTKVGVPTNLTTGGVKQVFTTTLKDFGATGGGRALDLTNVALDDTHLSKLDKLQGRIYGWTDTTPTGLNRLRQVIDSYKLGGVNLGSSEKKFNSIVGALRTNLSEYVGSRVPQIAEMNQKYDAESKVIDDITSQLKLGKGDPNTALRKLVNVFNPKSAVYRPVVRMLGEQGATNLMSDIAGLTMSKWTPGGIAKYLDTALGAGALLHPALIPEAIPAAAMSSPRIVGETVTTAGKIAQNKTAQQVGRVTRALGSGGGRLFARQAGLSK